MSAVESLIEQAKRIHTDIGKDRLAQFRSDALKQFTSEGFPSLRNEHWKYTDVRRIANKDFSVESNLKQATREQYDDARIKQLDCYELVFANGVLQNDLSQLNSLPDDVVITDLKSAILQYPELLENNINISSDDRTTAFSSLNSAFLNQGSFIHIPDNTVIEKPINLLYLSGNATELISSQPRNIIVFGNNAEATIIESYIGVDESTYFTNSVTELKLAKNSHCQHYKIQQESHSAFHIGSLKVLQRKDSSLNSHSISLGAALVRNDIHSQLVEPGSKINMNGLYVAGGKQHVDNHTLVEHLVPHTHSNQVYRGVINDHGRGVFNGKVIVHKDAQKTEAYQSNANLLLSDAAEVDTKPELEIYADDVKCSHGATVGQLDHNMLFYLRSRAIDEETAKSLLTFAFAEEVIKEITLKPIRSRLEQTVIGRLPDADVIQEFTHE